MRFQCCRLTAVLIVKSEIFRIWNDSRSTGYIYDYFTSNYDDISNDEHGNLKSYQYYIHGRPIGMRVHFYSNGNLKRITHDIFSHDRYGIMFEWYEGYSYYICDRISFWKSND